MRALTRYTRPAAPVIAMLALTLTATPASAATDLLDALLNPEVRQLLDPATADGQPQTQREWRLDLARDGAIQGRPGNRHTTALTVFDAAAIGDPALVPYVSFSVVDEQCENGTCARLQTVTGWLTKPAGLTLTQDGTARLRISIDEDTPQVQVVRAPGVPAGPLEIDASIAPVTPFTTAITLQNAAHIGRTQGWNSDYYNANLPDQQRRAAASGAVFGIPLPLQAEDSGTITLRLGMIARRPGIPLVQTPAQRRARVPRVAGGRIISGHTISADLVSFLDRTPVASTGTRFPGNRHQIQARLALSADTQDFSVAIESRNCAEGQDWFDCEAIGQGATLTPLGPPTIVAGADGWFGVTGTYGVAPADQRDEDAQAWGTIRVAARWAPGRVGVPTDSWTFNRDASGRLSLGEDHQLSYTINHPSGTAARSRLTVGSAILLPAQDFPTGDQVAYKLRTFATTGP